LMRSSAPSTETSAEPSLQAKQLKLKRARLADDLNDKISHRPGPIELVHKNILSVKKLKYHQYIPPDQKADKERPPQMDSPQADQAPTTSSSPSPSRTSLTTTTAAPLAQNPTARQSQAAAAGTKPATLPANLDEFKVAELKQELKLRGLTVSGTKNDLIERLRNYQEQNDNATALFKNAISQSVQQASTSVANTTTTTSASNTTSPSDHHPAEGGCFKLALSSLAQAVPGRVMRFGSTSSSPPVSPTPSERSLAGLSPDEASCNGDMFGEMVTSPLTQLTLHPSPQHPSHIASLPQPFSVVKEEVQSSCSLSKSSPVLLQPKESLSAGAMDTSSMDKDQMLQEKDKQIEELTRMLRQKQRLVETLRSQLEQGKMAGGVVVKKEGTELSRTSSEVKLQTLIKASSIQTPMLPNGIVLTVKEEVEPEKGMEGVIKEAQAKKLTEPMQCSQETLLRLQQIHQLQLQQAEHQKQQLQPKQRQGQVSPVIVNQQNGTPLHTQAIALDLKANGMPTLVTDTNGNHYLIALSSHARDRPNGVSSLAKINGRITLQVQGV
ncbi:hypothetical protein GOODEAATRI_005398, partial [Goodea atripinnis]